MEVFARPASYDPSEDATVRVKAGEVRKRLGLYYSDQGAHDPVRIELPSGTYVPEFHLNGSAADASVAPAIVEAPAAAPPSPAIPAKQPLSRVWVAVAVLIALIAAAGIWKFQIRGSRTKLDEL